MKKIIMLSLIATVIMMGSCQKKSPQPLNQSQSPNSVATFSLDTSKAGSYKMVASSISTELNTSLVVTLHYRNYSYYDQDTNHKMVRYIFPNNINSIPGLMRISAAQTYTNEGVNHSQPFIDTYAGNISAGFNESSRILLNSTGSKFVADTMIINFSIQPSSGPGYSLLCKYKKI